MSSMLLETVGLGPVLALSSSEIFQINAKAFNINSYTTDESSHT